MSGTYSYSVNAPVLTLQFSDFKYSLTICTDLLWNYVLIGPPFTKLTPNTAGGGTLSVWTNDTTWVGIFIVRVNGTVGGLYNHSMSFNIEVLAPPPPPPPTPTPTQTPTPLPTPTPIPNPTPSTPPPIKETIENL